jgi:hypothetical protein
MELDSAAKFLQLKTLNSSHWHKFNGVDQRRTDHRRFSGYATGRIVSGGDRSVRSDDRAPPLIARNIKGSPLGQLYPDVN